MNTKKNIITINGQDYKVYSRKVHTDFARFCDLPKIKDENKRWYIMDGAGEQYHNGGNKQFGVAFPNDTTAFYDWFTFGGEKYAVEQFIIDHLTGFFYNADNCYCPLWVSGFDGEHIKVLSPIAR